MVRLSAHDGAMFWFLGCSIAFLLLTAVGWLWLKHRQDAKQRRVT
jgi:hypothetical protein